MITFSRIVYGMRTISLLNVEKPTDNKTSRCSATAADARSRRCSGGDGDQSYLAPARNLSARRSQRLLF